MGLLIEDERYEEAAKILVERPIGAQECLILGASIPLEDSSLQSIIEDSVNRLDSNVLKQMLGDESLPLRVKISSFKRSH